jgi:hypothetical protein
MENKDTKEYRAICEQGDLGLFAEVLNEADQKTLNSNNNKVNDTGHDS